MSSVSCHPQMVFITFDDWINGERDKQKMVYWVFLSPTMESKGNSSTQNLPEKGILNSSNKLYM